MHPCRFLLLCCVFARLGWPELLDHPFVRETATERLKRERALADAVELADSSRAWKVRSSAQRQQLWQGRWLQCGVLLPKRVFRAMLHQSQQQQT